MTEQMLRQYTVLVSIMSHEYPLNVPAPHHFTFAVRFMRIFLFMVIVNGVQLLSSNFFAAIGKPLKGMLLSLTRQVFFLIPLLLILPLFFGMDGILFSAPIADTAAFLTTVILIRKEMNLMREQELALK